MPEVVQDWKRFHAMFWITADPQSGCLATGKSELILVLTVITNFKNMRHVILQIGKEGRPNYGPRGKWVCLVRCGVCVCVYWLQRKIEDCYFSKQQTVLLLNTDWNHQAFPVACSLRVQSVNALRVRSSYSLFATKSCAWASIAFLPDTTSLIGELYRVFGGVYWLQI
jgi:hypothetical protein